MFVCLFSAVVFTACSTATASAVSLTTLKEDVKKTWSDLPWQGSSIEPVSMVLNPLETFFGRIDESVSHAGEEVRATITHAAEEYLRALQATGEEFRRAIDHAHEKADQLLTKAHWVLASSIDRAEKALQRCIDSLGREARQTVRELEKSGLILIAEATKSVRQIIHRDLPIATLNIALVIIRIVAIVVALVLCAFLALRIRKWKVSTIVLVRNSALVLAAAAAIVIPFSMTDLPFHLVNRPSPLAVQDEDRLWREFLNAKTPYQGLLKASQAKASLEAGPYLEGQVIGSGDNRFEVGKRINILNCSIEILEVLQDS